MKRRGIIIIIMAKGFLLSIQIDFYNSLINFYIGTWDYIKYSKHLCYANYTDFKYKKGRLDFLSLIFPAKYLLLLSKITIFLLVFSYTQ